MTNIEKGKKKKMLGCMHINSSQTKELATTEDAYEVALKIEEKTLALI